MHIKLLANTPNPEKIIACSAKLCYSSSDIDSLLENLTEEKVNSFVKQLESYGHESPFEHVTFTFAVEGISRALTHQLVRHRIASYSQKSQRYVKENQFEYIIPKIIENNCEAKDIFVKTMEAEQKAYNEIVNVLVKEFSNGHEDLSSEETSKLYKKAIENARYVLPNACETKIIVTMNVRTLYNFFKLRCCERAQDEIRELANEMLAICKEVSPILFKHAGPSCVRGKCPEGKMSCGNPKRGD